MTDLAEIDWSKSDEYSEGTCTCRCETVFRSHSRFVLVINGGVGGIVARKPCPGCGRQDNIRRSASDPETVTIGKADS